ncbi:MAG TPA: ChbG/HpnK family deacetylase [bacterium]|nr:ChbG/HpnK family deacetylase [bacterium]
MILPSRPLDPWTGPLPSAQGRLGASLILPVPLDRFAPINVEEALRYVASLQRFLTERFGRSHEILLVPFGEKNPAYGARLDRLSRTTLDRKPFRWIGGSHSGPGSAVREGIFLSQGRTLLVGNLECHYGPSFFKAALARLGPKVRAVMANRRLPDSEFTVPVTALSLLYRRHLLGVLLGHLWSLLFKLPLTDNLAGAYVLERTFALRVFNRLTCPGFLYEAELALVAKANGYRLTDLPASFFLEREKPRLRVYREIGSVLRWTWRFLKGLRQGDYSFLRLNRNRLTADDWGLSPAINDAILEMARLGHLRRVSVLAGGKFMGYRLAELKRVPGIEFGLHFNLTSPESGGLYRSVGGFLDDWFRSLAGGRAQLAGKIRAELIGQLALLRKMGIRPRRLESHHHVHAVPGVLEALSKTLHAQGIRQVRVPYHPSLWWGKRALVAWFGRSLKDRVRWLGFRTEPFYYPLPGDLSNFNRLVRCLNRVADSEVLIHPAIHNDIPQAAPSDGYREGRVNEFNLLRLLALELTAQDKGA